jgi:hypothetical protein
VAYGARLESVLGESPRGFESPILRQKRALACCAKGPAVRANSGADRPGLGVQKLQITVSPLPGPPASHLATSSIEKLRVKEELSPSGNTGPLRSSRHCGAII